MSNPVICCVYVNAETISFAYTLVNCFYLTHTGWNGCNSLHMLLLPNVLVVGSQALGFVRVVVTVIRPTG